MLTQHDRPRFLGATFGAGIALFGEIPKVVRETSTTRETFLSDVRTMFPDSMLLISKSGEGLLHCEVAALREYLEGALAKKEEWECEKVLRYVGELIPGSDAALENALLVSFIEDLALGNLSDDDKSVIRQRAPANVLRLLRHHTRI